MKYIKSYESTEEEITLKYNIGDYVILNVDDIKKNNDDYYLSHDWRPKDPTDNIVKIINIKYMIYYHVKFYNGMDDDFCLIEDKEILRNATQKEIDNFKLKKKLYKETIKYNL